MLPDIKASSSKLQSALDAEMDAVLNAGSGVSLKEEQQKEAGPGGGGIKQRRVDGGQSQLGGDSNTD